MKNFLKKQIWSHPIPHVSSKFVYYLLLSLFIKGFQFHHDALSWSFWLQKCLREQRHIIHFCICISVLRIHVCYVCVCICTSQHHKIYQHSYIKPFNRICYWHMNIYTHMKKYSRKSSKSYSQQIFQTYKRRKLKNRSTILTVSAFI